MNWATKSRNNNQINDERIPITPYFLIFIALLFVPGVYLILILSAIVPFLLYYILAIGLNQSPEKTGSDNILPRLVGFGAIISFYACLRGIWFTIFRKPRSELALALNLKMQPRLNSFILEICKTLKTDSPDEVILLAEPSFFVQKGKLKVSNGEVKKKILAIGLPLLNVLSLAELRAILVHEFAHFTGNDTLYSSFVLPVYLGTQETIKRLGAEAEIKSESIQGILFGFITKIPMYLPLVILYSYLKLFQLLDMKLSRIREKRADIIAALVCGSKTFADSLKKVVRISPAFISVSRSQIIDFLEDDKTYINYYETFRNSLPEIWDSSLQFELDALREKEDFFSPHPTLKTRLEYLPDNLENYNDNETAISIIEDLDVYEELLTKHYIKHISILFQDEIRSRKNLSKPKENEQVAPIKSSHLYTFICAVNGEIRKVGRKKCPHCSMLTYENSHCHICGKPLKSIVY